jgi:predicted transport protein
LKFKERILNQGPDITTEATKLYVVFKAQSNVVSVVFQRSQLKLFLALPKGTLNDPYNHARDVSNVGHGDRRLRSNNQNKQTSTRECR